VPDTDATANPNVSMIGRDARAHQCKDKGGEQIQVAS